MKKTIITILFLLSISIQTQALMITHPESQDLTVTENAIFFSGKIERHEKVFINNEQIIPSKARAFSHSVPLKIGENIFAVQKIDWRGNIETIKYTILRVDNKQAQYQNEFVESPKRYYETQKNNTILRNTPIDAGINRLGYLPKGTKVVVDGTQNNFSRVYLTKNRCGWIMTKDLKILPPQTKIEIDEETQEEKIIEAFEYLPKKLIGTEQTKDEKSKTFKVMLSEDCPYSAIADINRLTLTIFNLDNTNETYTKDFTLGKFPRYSVTMQNNILEVKFKKCPIEKNTYSNRDVKIVIDAGHGGKEVGAIGCLGHREKNINLDVALKLKRILEQHNFQVFMTRETDKFMSLEDRVKFAKDKDALFFVSIHLNSVPISSNPKLNEGSLVFYYNPSCKQLAQEMVKPLTQELGTRNEGVGQASFAVIRPTEYIGVLAELAYLVNPKDVSIYKSKRFAHQSAIGIYKGLVNYIHSAL